MHKSSYLRMEYLLKFYESIWAGNRENVNILEIGSRGADTYKKFFTKPAYHYTGLDMVEGVNVDVVPEDIYCWKEIADESFDLVISGQVFEHIEYPWLTIREMARVLKPSGLCVITAPNSGLEHKAPKDCYRYYADGYVALAKWAGMKVHHTSIAGVPETEDERDWINDWNDGCLVAQKEPAETITLGNPFIQERRVPTYGYFDTYRIWELAVQRACKKFDEKKPIALFGAGWIGDMVLDILGADKVYLFVDNSQNKIGKEHRHKKIISFEDYLKESSRYNCLITASYKASMEIKEDMEHRGIPYAILYSED